MPEPTIPLELPDVVNTPPVNPAAAIASLSENSESVAGGDASSSSGPDTGSRNADPSATPPAEVAAPAKRGPGRPKTKEATTTETITGKRLKDLRKEEINTLLVDRDRELKEEREKNVRLELELQRSRAAVEIDKRSEIDDAIGDMVGGAVDIASGLAVAKWGPAAAVNSEQRTRVITPVTRVAKIYLGKYAEFSPEAAALLAVLAVVSEKYADVTLAGSAPRKPELVANDA